MKLSKLIVIHAVLSPLESVYFLVKKLNIFVKTKLKLADLNFFQNKNYSRGKS